MDWANAAWVVLTGSLVAASAGLIGSFLILRRMAMLGDAISHAVLPGIVIAFMVTDQTYSPFTVLFAGALGLLTTFAVQSLSRVGVQEDAGIGVTFTSLFALGVVMVTVFAGQVHLDLDHVLYGEIAYVPFDTLTIGGASVGPKAVWTMLPVFLLNLSVIWLMYKEFKICSFDPQMAAAVGINVALVHYLMMGLVSITTVSAFDAVGAILVVAMLIVPGATAYLLTERLGAMLALSVLFGVASSVLGYVLAVALDSSIAGAMTTSAGAMFALAFVLAPRTGLLARLLAQRRPAGQNGTAEGAQ